MPKINLETIKKNVYENSLQTCEYIEGYINRNSIIKVHCNIHNINFETKYENLARASRKHHVCPQCQLEDKQLKKDEKRVTIKCAYCGKEFERLESHSISKSGLYFCCREHKDLAQKIDSGEQFYAIRPEHYGTIESKSEYRKKAFQNYPHKCAICNWDEDEDVLQVHHIDENRKNAKLDNLIILCPTCHWKLTIGKYQLIDRSKIVKRNIL